MWSICVPSRGCSATLYRTMRSIDPAVLGRLGGAVARVRNRVWGRLVNTDGPVVLHIDSSLHEVHSENKEATPLRVA